MLCSFSSQGRQKSGKAIDAFKKHQAALDQTRADEDEKLKALPVLSIEDKGSGRTWLDDMVTKVGVMCVPHWLDISATRW